MTLGKQSCQCSELTDLSDWGSELGKEACAIGDVAAGFQPGDLLTHPL